LGAPAAVSNIPVNREQDGHGLPVRYFNPADASGLAG
jgi:hypothetical protein